MQRLRFLVTHSFKLMQRSFCAPCRNRNCTPAWLLFLMSGRGGQYKIRMRVACVALAGNGHVRVRKCHLVWCLCSQSFITYKYVINRNTPSLAVWSSGMIPASGAGGPGFNSRNSPVSAHRPRCKQKHARPPISNRHLWDSSPRGETPLA